MRSPTSGRALGRRRESLSRRSRSGARGRRRASALITLIIFGPLTHAIAASAASPLTRPGRDGLSPTFSLGFDSFSEKYSIEDADTLDLSNELRSSVGLTYRRGWGSEVNPGREASVFQIKDVLTVSDAAIRNRWDVDLELAVRSGDRLSLSNELSSRRIDPGGDLNLSSDYIQDVARFYYRDRLSEILVFTLRDRFEVIDFDEEDAYETDYRRNEASAELAIEPGLDGSVEFAYTRGDRAVPDSSAIDYREHALRVTWWQGFGWSTRVEAQGEIERRRYRDEVTRPGYFLITGDGHLAVALTQRLEVRLHEELEVTSYDALSQVYFDRFLQRAGLEAAVSVTAALELGLEPRYTFLRAEEESEEDYDEWSAVLAGDWIRLDRLWLTSSVEIGRRDYRVAETQGSIFSDYTFVRTDLFSTFELSRLITWNVYMSREPERHAIEDDDTTTTLFSTELTVKF